MRPLANGLRPSPGKALLRPLPPPLPPCCRLCVQLCDQARLFERARFARRLARRGHADQPPRRAYRRGLRAVDAGPGGRDQARCRAAPLTAQED
eukprot:scaffold4803_cov104-Isochrysis_galbana.AAC.2